MKRIYVIVLLSLSGCFLNNEVKENPNQIVLLQKVEELKTSNDEWIAFGEVINKKIIILGDEALKLKDENKKLKNYIKILHMRLGEKK